MSDFNFKRSSTLSLSLSLKSIKLLTWANLIGIDKPLSVDRNHLVAMLIYLQGFAPNEPALAAPIR